MNKIAIYSIRLVAGLIALFLLIYVAAYVYVTSNKKSLIEQVTQQINSRLNGEVHFKNIDLSFVSTFPQISVVLHQVSINDTLAKPQNRAFFTAEKFFVRISVINLALKKNALTGLKIYRGNLFLYTDTAGITNQYLFRLKKSTQIQEGKETNNTLDEIDLNDCRITIDDRQQNKLLDFDIRKMRCNIDLDGAVYTLKTRNEVLINSLAFNSDKGSFVKGKKFLGNITFYFNAQHRQLHFNTTSIKIDRQVFDLSGKFVFNESPQFALVVNTKKITIEEAKSLLPEKTATAISIVSLSKPLSVKASINGPLSKGDPLVNIEWETQEQNTVTTPFFIFEDCNFTGGYTNELITGLPRKDPNSRIYLHGFSGSWAGIPLTSENIYIYNLFVPKINLDLHSNFQLSALNKLLQSQSISLLEGTGKLNVIYSGPLIENDNTNTTINGSLTMNDGLINYLPRNITLKNCIGTIQFKNTDVSVDNLSCRVQGSHIVMNGQIKNMLALIANSPGKISLDWKVFSPNLDVADITLLLKKRKTVAARYSSKNKLGPVARQIDNMLEQSNVRLDFSADKLVFRKFVATDIQSLIIMEQDNWHLQNIKLKCGGGAIQLKGRLNGKSNEVQTLMLAANIENTNVKSLMYAFEDFGQDGISYKNLGGNLTSRVNVTMDIDRNLQAKPSNMNGEVIFSIKQGVLSNYEPLAKIQKFIFKNRDFNDIRFAELKDRFVIKGKDIIINRMEIQSTALTLFVKGVFNMQGNTDISIQVPLSNLKKRGDDYKPTNIGADEKAGASIYLRGKPGDDGNIKFKLDLFKKLRKDEKTTTE